MKPSISIKIPTPNAKVAMGWGDYHYAVSLANHLEQLGHTTAISFFNDWEQDRDQGDVDLVIHGGRMFQPTDGKRAILWVISHPSKVTKAERDAYDWVYVASHTLADQWIGEGSQNVSALLQATDGTRFYPGERDADYAHDILFVGSRHKKKIRKVVDYAVQIDAPISVYGGMWDTLLPPEMVAGKTIPNDKLGLYYRSAGMVLNDHWPDMAGNGILSNRMFDVLASGRPLISDKPKGVPSEIADYTYFYHSPETLRGCIKHASAETQEHAEMRQEFAKHILANHSFACRAVEISEKIETCSNAAVVQHPLDAPDPFRFCVVTCVKNEGPYLLEWIAHNRRIGVTDFLIFSNDCDDGTTEILDRLDDMGIVRHIPNPSAFTLEAPHTTCLRYAPFHRVFQDADYIIVSDVDEFITFADPDLTLDAYIRQLGEPDVVSLSELIFGFGGVETFVDKPVLEQFHYSNDLRPGRHRARRGVKSIMRNNGKIQAFTNHRPKIKNAFVKDLKWTDASGRPVSSDFISANDRGFDARGCYDVAILNHFTLRSGESMLAKLYRGDAVKKGRLDSRYFRKRNRNRLKVDHHQPASKAVRKEIDALLSDDVLAAAHARSVALTKDRISTLKQDPELAEQWNEILAIVQSFTPQQSEPPRD